MSFQHNAARFLVGTGPTPKKIHRERREIREKSKEEEENPHP